MLSDYFNAYAEQHKPYKKGPWCYEDGLIYRGLEFLHGASGEQYWLDHIIRMADKQIEPGPVLLGYNLSDYNIDNILPGRSLLYLHAQTGESRYLDAADILIRQLATQPRTKSGVYWHKLRYPWQIWLDGLHMGVPFQIAHAQVTGRPEAVKDAISQIKTALDVTRDPASGLYHHAYDEAREQPWANPVTGLSPAFWARAIGWMAMALVDVAELVGPVAFAPLMDDTNKLLQRLLDLRCQDGLWLQVIDRPDLAGNYEEASASAMFVYALMKGQNIGLIDAPSQQLYDTLVAKTIRKTGSGAFEMFGMCEVAGLGMYENRFRDGSAEYYVTEKVVADDPKGVGPLMLCAALAANL